MSHSPADTHATGIATDKGQLTVEGGQTSKSDMMAKGVATAVAASTIIQTGKGAMNAIARHPLAVFSLGIVAGIFMHKYRKEIISMTCKTAEQGKGFVLRQQEIMKGLLADARKDAEDEKDMK